MDNKVVLLGTYGGDETHCLSAWQSTNVELGVELPHNVERRIHVLFEETVVKKKKPPQELLTMLAQHGHHTPFEKSALHFQVTGDIASHIHCLKHRVATSINSESARYKKLANKHYLPEDFRGIPVQDIGLGKGAYDWYEVLDNFAQESEKLYETAARELTPILGRKRAKESARFFLTYNKQLDFDIMFNFRSFANFYGLRGTPHAQVEIQNIADQMLALIKELPQFTMSLEAFGLA